MSRKRTLSFVGIIAIPLALLMSPVHAAGPLDGEWVGKSSEEAGDGDHCKGIFEIERAVVADGVLTLSAKNYGRSVEIKEKFENGEIDGWHGLTIKSVQHVEWDEQAKFKISADGNLLKGYFSVEHSGRGYASCGGNITLARKGSVEAEAMQTGSDTKIVALSRRLSQITNTRADEAEQLPTIARDGEWIAKVSADTSKCELVSALESVSVEQGRVHIAFLHGSKKTTIEGKVGTDGGLESWVRLRADASASLAGIAGNEHADVDTEFKFQATFKGDTATGYLYANVPVNHHSVICSLRLAFAHAASPEAEAMRSGRDLAAIRLERQIAALANRAPDNAAARAEAEKLEAQRKQQELQLAELREQQSQLAARQKAENERLARLRETEEARLAEARATEESRLAKLRSEQEQLAARQKAESDRLAKLRAAEEARIAELRQEAARQAEQLAALRNPAAASTAPKRDTLTASINFGKYHALVIGVNDYEDLPKLKTAVSDAEAVAEVLADKYNFKVTKLINPTRDDILDTLDDLRSTLKFRDNLLIYYAGHGWLDDKADRGYWLPANAKKNRRSRWVSNATITDTLKAIEAKHVMVVADSCYSGRLVRSAGIRIEGIDDPDFYKEMSRKKARVVITSGSLEPVEDGKGKHSPFAREFLKALNENDAVLDGSKLFNAIRRPVMVNTNQTPQYSDVRRAGHDGGEFLFVRRQ